MSRVFATGDRIIYKQRQSQKSLIDPSGGKEFAPNLDDRYNPCVKRSLMSLLTILVGACTIVSASPKRESVVGRIVAYDNPLTCLNGNAYRSVIIRVQNLQEVGSEFIQVDFSHPCNEDPKWLKARSSIQKFHLIRDKDRDTTLNEFLDCVDKSSDKTKPCARRIWEQVPGAEQDKLPFGQRVACYRSADLPLVPVV